MLAGQIPRARHRNRDQARRSAPCCNRTRSGAHSITGSTSAPSCRRKSCRGICMPCCLPRRLQHGPPSCAGRGAAHGSRIDTGETALHYRDECAIAAPFPVPDRHDVHEVHGEASPGSAPSTTTGPVTGLRKGKVHAWLGRSSRPRTLPAKQSSADNATIVPGCTVTSGALPPKAEAYCSGVGLRETTSGVFKMSSGCSKQLAREGRTCPDAYVTLAATDPEVDEPEGLSPQFCPGCCDTYSTAGVPALASLGRRVGGRCACCTSAPTPRARSPYVGQRDRVNDSDAWIPGVVEPLLDILCPAPDLHAAEDNRIGAVLFDGSDAFRGQPLDQPVTLCLGSAPALRPGSAGGHRGQPRRQQHAAERG